MDFSPIISRPKLIELRYQFVNYVRGFLNKRAIEGILLV